MRRRTFLLGAAAGAAAVTTWWARPEDRGAGGHGAYFERLSDLMRKHQLARPTMLLDLNGLDHNIAEVTSTIGKREFRIVAKSLPSAPLLDYVMARADTNRLMVFHQPFLNAIASAHPETDVLLGKPMPVPAADVFYEALQPGPFDPARQLQWLIDTPERLRQYAELARGRRVRARLNLEIDVGLHRGGFESPAELSRALDVIAADPWLEFGGLMGYDPHVAKVPKLFRGQAREFERVRSHYRGFVEAIRAHATISEPKAEEDELTFNAAGSPTYRLWNDIDGLANELAVGSALVKPLDFDIETLSTHVPALFIGTPVLKASDDVRLPALDGLGAAHAIWDPNRSRSFFVYGGFWKARPVSPPGLTSNPIFGSSTNQEMLNGSRRVELAVDDYVFYRPTQSEFVMLQFGDIAAVRGDQLVDLWSPLDQGG